MAMRDHCQNPVFCNCRAPAAGIQAELLVDLLWNSLPADPAGSLRGERPNHPVGESEVQAYGLRLRELATSS